MSIMLGDLMRNKRTIEVPVGDEVCKVTYKPNAYTVETETLVQEAFEAHRPGKAQGLLLCALLMDWDLVDENGDRLPINEETIDRLPTRFINEMVSAIMADINADKEERKNSGGGSLANQTKAARRGLN